MNSDTYGAPSCSWAPTNLPASAISKSAVNVAPGCSGPVARTRVCMPSVRVGGLGQTGNVKDPSAEHDGGPKATPLTRGFTVHPVHEVCTGGIGGDGIGNGLGPLSLQAASAAS